MALTGNAMPENVLIVTDSRGSLLERRIVSEIAYRVALTDIGWSNLFTSVISKNNAAELVQVSHDSMQDDLAKMLFMEKLDEARPYLDTGRIIEYSLKMDPELNRALTKGAAVDDALWGAYSRSMQGNSWEGSLNYFGVLVDEASRMGYPNVIEVLFHHKVIAAEFGEPGDVPYHLIGRGFVAEGARYIVLTSYTYAMFLYSDDPRKIYMANSYIKDDVLPFFNHGHTIDAGTQHELMYYVAKRGRDYFSQLLDNKIPGIKLIKEFVPSADQYGPVVKIYSVLQNK